jgi:tape measure domain-containing protein
MMDFASLGIRVDSSQVNTASRDLHSLSSAAGNAEASTSRLSSAARTLGPVIGAIGFASLAHDILKTVEQVQNLELRLKGLTKGAQDYAASQEYLSAVSVKHHKNILDLTSSYAGLLAIEQTGIITRQQSKALLEGLSNVQSKTGASADALKSSVIGLNQALGMGTLQWEEMKQVTEPLPGLMMKIAEAAGYTGKSAIGDFKAVVSAGQVTSDMFGKIMVEALGQYQGAAEAAGGTLTAQYSDVKNAWVNLADALEEPISDTLTPILKFASWQLGEIVKQVNYLKYLYNGGVTGGSGDNGMTVDLTGRAKPPAEVSKPNETAAAIRKEIEATAGTHKKAADSAIKDAQRKAEAIVKGIQDEMQALDDHHKKLTLSERDYYASTLAAKGMGAAQKAMALAVWDSNKALEAQKTSNDKVKTEMESLVDHYNQLTLSARDYYEAKLKADGIGSDKAGLLLAQFDKNSAVEAQQRSIESARDSMQAYDDLIKQVNDSTGKLGATNQAVFDGALGGINTLVGVFQNMGESIKETTKQQEALNAAYAKEKNSVNNSGLNERQKYTLMLGKEGDYLKANQKLERDKTNEALTGTRQIIAATARMFDEKSSSAKALHNLETGLAVAQMAMQGVQMAKDAAATAVSLAAGAAKMFSQSGWGGFAGVAAMGAVMAGLGYAAFGGGGGSSAKPVYSTDTGTVLGDSTAKSESIDKTYQLLKDIHADEYAELRGINRGIASLSTGITDVITRLFQAGGIKDFATLPTGKLTGISGMLTSIDPINKAGFDPIGKAILGFLFGGKQTSTVTAQGISTGATSISDIMAGGNLTANQFATIETKTKGGLFGKDKTKYSEQYAALDEATQKSLNTVFSSMGDTMLGLAESLGHDTKQKVEGYIIPSMKVDLKGLSGEESAKKLNGVISAALDTMSTAVFGGIIGQYQKMGEGMLETAVRIVAEVAVVKDALGKSGLSIAGDAIAISDALVQAAGGLQEFQKAFDDYYQKFYTESERNVFLQKNLTSQLGDLNTILPATRDGYRKLVESLDVNNAADAQRYSLLIKLSGAADDYYKVLESGAEAALQLAKQQRALDIQLMELSGNAIGALTEKRKDELAAMDESLRFSQQAVWALSAANKAVDDGMAILKKSVTDQKAINNAAYQATISANNLQKQAANDLLSALKTVAGNIKTALGSTIIESDEFSRQRRKSAMGVLQSALSYSSAGGSLANFNGMDQALLDIAKPSEQLYSSFVDFARDQGRASNVLSGLADNTKSQISVAELTLKAIEDSTKALTDGFNAENSRLDALVTNAQAQIDAINGTTAVVMTVNDAVNNLAFVMNAKLTTEKSIESAKNAEKGEFSAKSIYDAAAAKAAQSQQAVNEAIAAAQRAAQNAQAAQNAANAPTAPAPTTWQNGQSGNAIWEQILSGFNAAHQARFGTQMNRAWSSDSDAQNQYQQLVAQYNVNSAAAVQAALANAAGLANVASASAALIPGYQATALADSQSAAQAAAAYATASAYATAAKAAVPGINSFAVGINEVPYDMTANIHQGERILPAADNKELIARLSEPRNAGNDELIQEIRELRATVQRQQATLNAIAANTKQTHDVLDSATAGGGPMLVEIA